MKYSLLLLTSFTAFAFAVGGCTATTTDSSDAQTTEDTGVGGDTADSGVRNDTGNPPGDSGTDGAVTDTGTPPADTGSDTSTGTDTSTWVPPPDPTAYYVRFVVATSDFTTGTPYDVCYLPWDGVTPPSSTDVYTGPIAGAYGGNFTAPEVSEYFNLALDSAHETVRIRLVGAGLDCTQASKFHITVAGTDHIVSVEDDTATFKPGYNTAIVFGNVNDSTGYQLLSTHDRDPTDAATVPTLQFFNGYSGDLGLTLTATDGTKYTLGTGPVPFKAYVSLPFTTSATTGTIHISNINFDPGGGATSIDIGLTDYAFDVGYFWAFSYGNNTDGLHFYLCGDSIKLASSGDVAVSGCLLK